jgi:PAS domain S-box-containing protein
MSTKTEHNFVHEDPLVEAHIRQLFETLPGMINICSADGQLEYVNHEILELLGVPFEEIVGSKWLNFLHPDDAPAASQEWLRCTTARDPYRYYFRVRTRDGTYRWCHSMCKPLLDERGEVVKYYGYLADVDDLRRADASLRESEHAMRLLIDSVPALVWRIDASRTIEFLNQRAAAYLGFALGDTSTIREHVHPEDREATLRACDIAHAKLEPASVICRLRGPTGAYSWFEIRGEPVVDADGRASGWYLFAVDIDNNVRMSEQLKASQAALEKASRMATVAELSASIAHEINQPLSAIVTNSAACDRWLSAPSPNMPRAKQSMERIVRDARCVSDVVERVRALYRYGPLSRTLLDLNAVVRETQELMRSECARAQVTVSLELSDALPTIMCDRVQIQQVLTNLIRNAIEAMKMSTTAVRNITLSTGIIDSTHVCLAVSDTGPGFSDDQRAFEAFYTTKESGMGIGLAICRSIVEAHGGTIVGRNLRPHGARLEMILPLAVATEAETFVKLEEVAR